MWLASEFDPICKNAHLWIPRKTIFLEKFFSGYMKEIEFDT